MGRANIATSSPNTTSGRRELASIGKDLIGLEGCFRTARKHGFKVASRDFYDSKARGHIAGITKNLIVLRGILRGRDSSVESSLAGVELMVERCDLRKEPVSQLKLLGMIKHRVDSEIAAAIESERQTAATPFLPPEIVPNGVYRRVLEEANTSSETGCYNACAAMLRRLIESLIIEVFEVRGIEDRIKSGDDYFELKALIGKATAELGLGRNSREALPKLKFLGDLSLHSRRNLIRHADLERFHGDIRVALEELASRAFDPKPRAAASPVEQSPDVEKRNEPR